MALINSRKLIKEFSDIIIEDYPELNHRQIAQVCRAPWFFLKDHMKNGDFDYVRFQYLGVFKVFPKKVISTLANLKVRFQAQNVSPEYYFPLKKKLEKFLEDVDTE